MEGGIERALLDALHVARNLLDALGYGPAMLRFQRKGLQDEQIQRSLWKVDTVRVVHALPFRFYKEHTGSLVELQGELGAWVATVQYSRVRASFSAARNRIALSPIENAIWAQGIVCVRSQRRFNSSPRESWDETLLSDRSCVVDLYRPMFEDDGLGTLESRIILFSFETCAAN